MDPSPLIQLLRVLALQPAPQTFDSKLSNQDEQQFQQWKKTHAPNDSGFDYDLRGAYNDQLALMPDPSGAGHMPDTYKKPNHPTFSNESIYAAHAPELAGHWEGEKYVPPKSSLARRVVN